MNPYDFVRLPERVDRKRVIAHEKLGLKCGSIRCRLTAITPILVPANQGRVGTQRFLSYRYLGAELPAIPGSSLKGVIRGVAEAASLSCIGLSAELFFYDRGISKLNVSEGYRQGINREMVTCNSTDRLCPACRLFGMVSSRSHYLGKVSIGEARTTPEKFKHGSQIILKPLMEPKPRHTAFYLPHEKVAGRKFYFHHTGPPRITTQATEYTRTVIPLEGLDQSGNPRTIFEFDVMFTNLADDEYSLLLFSLFLTENMRHKVGGGKPNGLGTSKIECASLRLIDPKQRYSRLTPGVGARSLEGQELSGHIQKATTAITSNPSLSVVDLERIWRYPPARSADGRPVEYQYPDQEWFAKNSDVPLSGTP